MKILLLMPIYKTMDAPCIISLVDFVQTLHNDGHEPKMIFVNGFNAAKARRMLTENVVDKKYDEFDYVLWLDSDHVYKTETFYKLVDTLENNKLGMVSATYTLHGCPDTAHGITKNDVFSHFRQDELKKGLIDCTVVGFGFLLMKREFLKNMYDKYGDNLFVLDSRQNCTEDVTFCRKVLDEGERVCFDSDIKVGHIELAVRY